MTLFSCIFASPIWELSLLANETHLLMMDFDESKELEKKIIKIAHSHGINPTEILRWENTLLTQVKIELDEYFSGNRKIFSIPLAVNGTEFQKKSWEWLRTIPYGETRNYQEQSTQIGHPKAVRAIWWANHNNHIVIVIPCHRVIGKSGKLVGYGGWLSRKTWLLEHEKKNL